MKERLVIKNFGPIKLVDLELGKMTILIGNNATGKSTIAKVLAVCRYFSYIVDCSYPIGSSTSFDEGLKYWGIFDYLKDDSYIEYQCKEYQFHAKYEIKDWDVDHNEFGEIVGEPTPIYAGANVNITWSSDKFKDLQDKLEKSKPFTGVKQNSVTSFHNWFGWSPSSNFFEIDVKQVMDNPFYFPTERGLQSVFSLGRSKSVNDSLYEQLADFYNIAKTFTKSTTIEGFDIKYKNVNGQGFVENKEGETFLLENSASGFQSVIPIQLVIKYYNEKEKRYNRTYIIEEPETNLFPKKQKSLIEFLVKSVNEFKNQIVIPTHSPYILSSIENLMYAYKLGNIENGIHKEKVKSIVNENYWINPDDVSVYYLNNGEAIDILDKNEALIDKEYIDSVSKIINDEFDKLLNIEVEYEH